MPVVPAPTPWRLPDPEGADPDGLVAIGADLEPGTVLTAYLLGLFPMPLGPGGPIGWWSPDPRGIIEVDGLHVSRSLRRSCRRFEVRVDTAFDEVVAACADPRRPRGWIDGRIRAAYERLHRMGWAHSIETWQEGRLVGGVYGIAVGGFFAGESMFHRVTDASKAALVALVGLLAEGDAGLFDVQWLTPHLASLGAIEISRSAYLARLDEAVGRPPPSRFGEATTHRELVAGISPRARVNFRTRRADYGTRSP